MINIWSTKKATTELCNDEKYFSRNKYADDFEKGKLYRVLIMPNCVLIQFLLYYSKAATS